MNAHYFWFEVILKNKEIWEISGYRLEIGDLPKKKNLTSISILYPAFCG